MEHRSDAVVDNALRDGWIRDVRGDRLDTPIVETRRGDDVHQHDALDRLLRAARSGERAPQQQLTGETLAQKSRAPRDDDVHRSRSVVPQRPMNCGARFAKNAAYAFVQVVAVEDPLLRRPSTATAPHRAAGPARHRPAPSRAGSTAVHARRSPLQARARRRAPSRFGDAVDDAPRERLFGMRSSSPVNSSSLARAGPDRVASAASTPLPASPPSRDSGRPIVTPRLQTRRSHASASSSPPPSAGPSIAAIVGIGSRARRRSTMSSNRIFCSLASCRMPANSLTSLPAQNARDRCRRAGSRSECPPARRHRPARGSSRATRPCRRG